MIHMAHKYVDVLNQRFSELCEAQLPPEKREDEWARVRNVFENLRLRQRKSLGRSFLVNPNKPNAGAGYALRLSACCSRL